MNKKATFDLYDIEQQVIQLLTDMDQLVYKVKHCPKLEEESTIRKITESMKHLYDIQQHIYHLNPDLIPEHLKNKE